MNDTKVIRVWVTGLCYEQCPGEGCDTWHPRAVSFEGDEALYNAVSQLHELGMVRKALHCHSSVKTSIDSRRETWREIFHHPETGVQVDLLWECSVTQRQPFGMAAAR